MQSELLLESFVGLVFTWRRLHDQRKSSFSTRIKALFKLESDSSGNLKELGHILYISHVRFHTKNRVLHICVEYTLLVFSGQTQINSRSRCRCSLQSNILWLTLVCDNIRNKVPVTYFGCGCPGPKQQQMTSSSHKRAGIFELTAILKIVLSYFWGFLTVFWPLPSIVYFLSLYRRLANIIQSASVTFG